MTVVARHQEGLGETSAGVVPWVGGCFVVRQRLARVVEVLDAGCSPVAGTGYGIGDGDGDGRGDPGGRPGRGTGSAMAASHLVDVAYLDGQYPRRERLLWELESVQPVESDRLGGLVGRSPAASADVVAHHFAACLTAGVVPPEPEFKMPGVTLPLRGSDRLLPVLAPLGVPITPLVHQWVPLGMALSQPQVRLLLADDVGLGKTIQAGLILRELLIRRRIQRVLVLCPPTLCEQWRRELLNSFRLEFLRVDRESSRRADGNRIHPFDVGPRLISSYYYLRRPEVLNQFMSPHGDWQRPSLPWDLLVVDEAHRLMPRGGSGRSDLTRMLEVLAPWFEHRIFLTATPHDGYSRSYSGLLHLLDPLRFQPTSLLNTAQRTDARSTVVRRTVKDLPPALFPSGRKVPVKQQKIDYDLCADETALYEAAGSLCLYLSRLSGACANEVPFSLMGELLRLRLLSSVRAFAVSYGRLAAELVNDQLKQATWIAQRYPALIRRIRDIRGALDRLMVTDAEDRADGEESREYQNAVFRDSKKDALLSWLVKQIGFGTTDGSRETPERVVVFSQYIDSLEALRDALFRQESIPPGAVAMLTGTMSPAQQERVVEAFVDPGAASRVLLATDSASEGLNLHPHARFLVHYDLTWNPARVAQRNGRIHRLGQSRDVVLASMHTDHPLHSAFLKRIREKAKRMRLDLGDETGTAGTETSAGLLFPCVVESEPAACRRIRDPAVERGLVWARDRLSVLRPATLLRQGYVGQAATTTATGGDACGVVVMGRMVAVNQEGDLLVSWPVVLVCRVGLDGGTWRLLSHRWAEAMWKGSSSNRGELWISGLSSRWDAIPLDAVEPEEGTWLVAREILEAVLPAVQVCLNADVASWSQFLRGVLHGKERLIRRDLKRLWDQRQSELTHTGAAAQQLGRVSILTGRKAAGVRSRGILFPGALSGELKRLQALEHEKSELSGRLERAREQARQAHDVRMSRLPRVMNIMGEPMMETTGVLVVLNSGSRS